MHFLISIAALAATSTGQNIVFGANTLPANVISKDGITTPSITDYDKEDLGNKAINAPINAKCPTYIGVQFFSDGRFDVQRCVAACEETTQYNAEFLNGRAVCRMVNTYVLQKNGKYEAQACAMYTRYWDASYATNAGYTTSTTDGQCDTDKYTISHSVTYANSKDRGGADSCIGDEQPPVTSSTTTAKTTISATSQITSTHPTGTGLCAGGKGLDSTYTARNGDVYGVCLNTDFGGNDIGPVDGIKDVKELAEACSKKAGCVAASLARGPQVGYLKKERSTASENLDVDSIYKISGGGQPPVSTTAHETTPITTGKTTISATPKTTFQTTTTKAQPSTTSAQTAPTCFKIRAGDRIEKRTTLSAKGKYLAKDKLNLLKFPLPDLMQFDNNLNAGTFVLDNNGQLRSCHTGAVAARYSKINNSQVFLDPIGKNYLRDALKCSINKKNDKWVLECQNKSGDGDYSLSGKYWFLGAYQAHLEPLSLHIEEDQCPADKKW